jgi:chemotaxis protein MotB
MLTTAAPGRWPTRLRHGHDGLLPADVADQHDQPGAEARHRRVTSRPPASAKPPAAPAASWAALALGDDGNKNQGSWPSWDQSGPEAPPSEQEDGQSSTTGAEGRCARSAEEALREELQPQEAAAFSAPAASLRQAMQSMPELAELSKHVRDRPDARRAAHPAGRPGRFARCSSPGSARRTPRAPAVARGLPRGEPAPQPCDHLATPARRCRQGEGDGPVVWSRKRHSRRSYRRRRDPDRINQVSGNAASAPLYPDDPTLAGNRRITQRCCCARPRPAAGCRCLT